MSLKDLLPKGVADALYEDDPAPTPKSILHVQPIVQQTTQWQPPAKTPLQPFAAAYPPSPNYPPPTVTGSSSAVTGFLDDLRAKTDFDATPIGQQLKGSLDALAGTGLSEEMMTKTAMKITHQSPAQVVAVLQGLTAVLTSEQQHFEASMQSATTQEVGARQAKSAQLQSSIDALSSQLDSLRQQKSQTDAELQQKQDKISSARTNFGAALEARNTELAEMISHYQSIPEVQ